MIESDHACIQIRAGDGEIHVHQTGHVLGPGHVVEVELCHHSAGSREESNPSVSSRSRRTEEYNNGNARLPAELLFSACRSRKHPGVLRHPDCVWRSLLDWLRQAPTSGYIHPTWVRKDVMFTTKGKHETKQSITNTGGLMLCTYIHTLCLSHGV